MALISINPQDAVKLAAFNIKDGDAVLKSLRATTFDYQGKREAVTVLEAKFDYNDEEITGRYTCGKSLMPSSDGKGFESVSEGVTGLPDSSNAFMFMASLVNAGFPVDKLGKDLSIADGTGVHVNSVPVPERENLAGNTKDKTIMIVTKINSLPWEKKKGGTKGKSTTKTSGGPSATNDVKPPASDNATEGVVVAALITALASKPEGIPKASIIQSVLPYLPEGPERTPALRMILSDEFLKTNQGWMYEGGVLRST